MMHGFAVIWPLILPLLTAIIGFVWTIRRMKIKITHLFFLGIAILFMFSIGVSLMIGLILLMPDTFEKAVRATPTENWEQEMKQADGFIAFGFGLGKDKNGVETPGITNLEIAKWILKNNPQRKPVIVQEGVYLALKQEAKNIDTWIIRLPHNPSVYVDTQAAALQSWAIMEKEKFKRVVLISHELQLQRMQWDFERCGLQKRIIIPGIQGSMKYDSNSVQHFGTKSRKGWLVRELIFTRPIKWVLNGINR